MSLQTRSTALRTSADASGWLPRMRRRNHHVREVVADGAHVDARDLLAVRGLHEARARILARDANALRGAHAAQHRLEDLVGPRFEHHGRRVVAGDVRRPWPLPSRKFDAGCDGHGARRLAEPGSLDKDGGPRDPPSFPHMARIPRQNMCCPPLIAMFAPVTKAASSLDRYATRPATSSGLPRRPIGICGMILESRTSLGIAITIFVPM